jgi:hypothetical protein
LARPAYPIAESIDVPDYNLLFLLYLFRLLVDFSRPRALIVRRARPMTDLRGAYVISADPGPRSVENSGRQRHGAAARNRYIGTATRPYANS